jgi:iron complex outermembrane receptor protein
MRLAGSVALIVLSLPAYSEETADAKAPGPLEEVIVTATGTLIRGIAPTGTNVVVMDREAIEVTGVTSTNDLLARVPQITNFFGTVPVPTTNLGSPINRPNIRDLGASGASTTLVLINNMRLPGAGFQQVSPDPSVIPPAVLDRVDVIPDGASALYGSDAVGGVINFVTRREFDGVEFTAKYGTSDPYDTREATLTAGTDWNGGNGLLSLYWTDNDSLLGGDRGWIGGNHSERGGDDFRVDNCTPGTITAGGVRYDMATLTPGENLCDLTDIASILPQQERRTLFASVNQSLADGIDLNVVAYYSSRDVDFAGNTGGTSTGVEGRGTITDANPFFMRIGSETTQTVAYSYDEVFGGASRNWGDYDAWNVIPELTIALPSDWQATLTLNYGGSDNAALTRGIDREYEAEALVATTRETAINPYNLAETHPDVLHRLTDYASAVGTSDQEVVQFRAIFDGGLFDTDNGEVRMALGLEYLEQEHKVTQGNATRLSAPETVSTSASRDIQSLFGELFIPVLGAGSVLGSFDLSMSVRHDDYSDLGDTSNPKLGFNWSPVDSLIVRGTWGSSFQAPSVADRANSVDERAQFIGLSPFRPADSGPLDLLRPTVLIAGGSDDLEPEKADTWSLGFDWEPEHIDRFKLSATYYSVDYENAIVVTPFFEPYFFDIASLEDTYLINPTLEEAQAFLADLRYDGFTSLEDLYASGRAPYLLTSARRINLGSIETSGIDYHISKGWTLSGVMLTGSISGNHLLERESQPVPGGERVDELDEGLTNRVNVTATLGAFYDRYTASLTTYYKDGFDNDVNSIKSFTTTNLFFAVYLPVNDLVESAQLSLNIDNVMDENPSYINDFDGIDTGHSFSVGRMFSLGVRVRL